MWLGIILGVVVLGVLWFICGKLFNDGGLDKISRERSGRIDVYSQNAEFKLTNVKAGGTIPVKYDYAHWAKPEDQEKHWFVEGGVGSGWEMMNIEFVPAATGYVLINLRGSFYEDMKLRHHDVLVDDCQAEGAVINNGSFEMVDPGGKPAYWGWTGSRKRYIKDGTLAHSGKFCIAVWHDLPLVQKIEVKAGNKYKISAWFKAYERKKS